ELDDDDGQHDEAEALDDEDLSRPGFRQHHHDVHAQLLSWMNFWTAAPAATGSSLVSITFSATSTVSRVTSDRSFTSVSFFSRPLPATLRSASALASVWALSTAARAVASASFRISWVLS